jgi:hypothetical protein
MPMILSLRGPGRGQAPAQLLPVTAARRLQALTVIRVTVTVC